MNEAVYKADYWNHDPSCSDPKVNMYGCTRCPNCHDDHRYRTVGEPDIVCCDDCGLKTSRVDKPESERHNSSCD